MHTHESIVDYYRLFYWYFHFHLAALSVSRRIIQGLRYPVVIIRRCCLAPTYIGSNSSSLVFEMHFPKWEKCIQRTLNAFRNSTLLYCTPTIDATNEVINIGNICASKLDCLIYSIIIKFFS